MENLEKSYEQMLKNMPGMSLLSWFSCLGKAKTRVRRAHQPSWKVISEQNTNKCLALELEYFKCLSLTSHIRSVWAFSAVE